MEALQERMAKDKDLNEIEKKPAKAMQGMNENNEKDLDALQQALGKMDAEQDGAEQLEQALKDLDNLSDALAKGQGDCPNCGKKKGEKDGCEGKGG
jgi:ABC-type transporter Mla subunit MlaD